MLGVWHACTRTGDSAPLQWAKNAYKTARRMVSIVGRGGPDQGREAGRGCGLQECSPRNSCAPWAVGPPSFGGGAQLEQQRTNSPTDRQADRPTDWPMGMDDGCVMGVCGMMHGDGHLGRWG